MKKKCRIIIPIASFQEDSIFQCHYKANHYLEAVATLFEIRLHHAVVDLPIEANDSLKPSCQKFLVYEFLDVQKHHLKILVGASEHLQCLGIFFDVWFENFPYSIQV